MKQRVRKLRTSNSTSAMNPERVPYAAVTDLESVVKQLSREGKGKVFIVYDPEQGWWAGDETDAPALDTKTGSLTVKGRTYVDWVRPNIAEALSAVAAARFIPGSDVVKLFRKAPPAAKPVTGKEATQPGGDSGEKGGPKKAKT